jgi:hypothetical protein
MHHARERRSPFKTTMGQSSMCSRNQICSLFLCTFFTAGALAQEPGIDTLSTSDAVIARVGPTVVTVREFFFASLFGPAFVKQRPDTRQKMLDYMLNEKLLALGARGHENDLRVRENLAALEGDMATEELYRDDILSKVHVSESEIIRGVAESRKTVSLRWLYRKDKPRAIAAVHELRSGLPFDSLYKREIADSGMSADDRQMRSTLFKLRLQNPPMATFAGTLRVGQVSDPIQGSDGFYILRIDSLVSAVPLSESEEAKTRSEVRQALVKARADSLSDIYVRRAMLEAHPIIQRPAFDLLRAYVGSRVFSAEKFASYELSRNVTETDYKEIDRYGKRVLVTLAKGKVTLADFLAWYRVREVNMTFRQNSPQVFFLSVEDVVWRMVRDRLLVKRSLDRGLQHRRSVVAQKTWWKEKLLYQVAKDSIMRTIGWNDSTLQAYYAHHPGAFRDTSGSLRAYDGVKDDVLREWYAGELNSRVLHTLNRLRQRYPVRIYEDVLKSVPLDAENDPSTIEVYTVKKGGTFPHPAFPTIDYFWRTWQ